MQVFINLKWILFANYSIGKESKENQNAVKKKKFNKLFAKNMLSLNLNKIKFITFENQPIIFNGKFSINYVEIGKQKDYMCL